MGTFRSPAGLSLSQEGEARWKQAGGEGHEGHIPGVYRFFTSILGNPSHSAHSKAKETNQKKNGLFFKCCSQLLKKGYKFSKCKRFQIKLIYFSDLLAHLRNYVLLKTCWVGSCNSSPHSFSDMLSYR